MQCKEIGTVEELRSLVGQEVAVGEWVEITQDRINLFADATGDYQWIHVDVERAKNESPFRTTIAHGFLTLSMMRFLITEMIKIKLPVRMRINYGLNKVRFPSPVFAGSRIRARATLLNFKEIPDGWQLIWNVTIERENSAKPCCVAEWLLLYYN